ncbi:hypothetical protein HOY80DRAFT_218788 [Tuber brumale]|nr:hypothetical protein HOY80DRAFT_218788 [Tuber brumale]
MLVRWSSLSFCFCLAPDIEICYCSVSFHQYLSFHQSVMCDTVMYSSTVLYNTILVLSDEPHLSNSSTPYEHYRTFNLSFVSDERSRVQLGNSGSFGMGCAGRPSRKYSRKSSSHQFQFRR